MDEPLLRLTGAAGAAWAYSAYRLLCLVSDANARRLYAHDACASLLAEQLRLQALIEQEARAAARVETLGETDRAWVEALAAAARDLSLMRQALEACLHDESDQARHRFEAARAEAFARVGALLGD